MSYGLVDGDSIRFEGGPVPDRYTYPDTYSLDVGYLLDGNSDNYDINVNAGTYTINKATLTVTTPTETKTYDGSVHPVNPDGATVSGDPFGHIWVEATGSTDGADVGEHTNGYYISISYEDPSHYIIKEELGTLTITKKDLTITSEAMSKPYDGTPLTLSPDQVSISGLAGDETVSLALSNNSITGVGSVNPSCTVNWGTAKEGNYNLVTPSLGALTVTANSTPITITAPSDSIVYNGQAIQAMGGATVEGSVPSGIKFIVTSSGGGQDVGEYDTGASYYILGPDGEPIDDSWFSGVTVKPGKIVITPLELALNLGGTSLDVNGRWRLPLPSLNGESGQNMPGENTFTLPDGKTATLTVSSNIVNSDNHIVDLNTGDTYNITYTLSLPEPTKNYTVSPSNTQYTITGTKDENKPSVVVDLHYGEVTYNDWVVPYPTVTYNGTNCSSVSESDFNSFNLPNGDVIHVSVSNVPALDAEPNDYPIGYGATFSSGNNDAYRLSFNNTVLHIVAYSDPSDPPSGYPGGE